MWPWPGLCVFVYIPLLCVHSEQRRRNWCAPSPEETMGLSGSGDSQGSCTRCWRHFGRERWRQSCNTDREDGDSAKLQSISPATTASRLVTLFSNVSTSQSPWKVLWAHFLYVMLEKNSYQLSCSLALCPPLFSWMKTIFPTYKKMKATFPNNKAEIVLTNLTNLRVRFDGDFVSGSLLSSFSCWKRSKQRGAEWERKGERERGMGREREKERDITLQHEQHDAFVQTSSGTPCITQLDSYGFICSGTALKWTVIKASGVLIWVGGVFFHSIL